MEGRQFAHCIFPSNFSGSYWSVIDNESCVTGFNGRFCSTGLPSDVVITVDRINFHLHKFPLISKCGKIMRICEESQRASDKQFTIVLEEFPGGPDTFLVAAKFCYGIRFELTARNIACVYCAADYLEMTDDYGEGNLLCKSESYFHRNILRSWKDCILALQSCDSIVSSTRKLHIISKCSNAICLMISTDPSLFGWPMMMYGSLQSPGGSILWNGINTGARIQRKESDWWFEDISYLSVGLFESLIKTMRTRGTKPESIAGAIMYYARKYLPGLSRRQIGESSKTRTVASFSLTPATVDQKVLVESIEKLLPEIKGKSYCRFLLGLLRVALILDVNHTCINSLERRIGVQLELATLDGLLIPNYSESDTLYNTDCVERIINHFVSVDSKVTPFSPSSHDLETKTSSGLLRQVAKLIDNYISEVASDANLKPANILSLVKALPESTRPLHDGLYRALDIYFKAHPSLSAREKEELCNVISYQKLSIDACAHASQNDRLPIRVVLQVLFCEQMHLRTALAGCLHVLDSENAPAGQVTVPSDMADQILKRDGWVSVVRENQVLKVDMQKMRSRVGELEEEISTIKQEMKKVRKSHNFLNSPRLVAQKCGCRLIPQYLVAQPSAIASSTSTPRASVEQGYSSRHSRHRKSFSLF